MMNRMGLGIAVGAGYVLGRTRKLKAAVAVGSLVAGKRLHLSPRALAELVNQQLRDNPQLKEIGDQMREDLRGVGKAASGAMVERQIEALADRLHSRTAQVRKQAAGGLVGGDEEEPAQESYDEEDEAGEEEPEEPEEPREDSGEKAAPAKEAAKAMQGAARKAPGKKTVGQTTKKVAKKVPGRGAEAKKSASPRKTAAKTASRGRPEKGVGER